GDTDVAIDVTTTSWPGLSRPSTSLDWRHSKDVDARHKAGHDGCVDESGLLLRLVRLRLIRRRLGLIELLDLRGLAQLGDEIGLRLASDKGLDLRLHVVKARGRFGALVL